MLNRKWDEIVTSDALFANHSSATIKKRKEGWGNFIHFLGDSGNQD